jgi:3-oxoacyl-[acyl-carrier-protein] synthase-1
MSASTTSIVGVGLACPLGLRSDHAVCAIEAGIVRFAELDPPPSIVAEPVRVSILDELDPTLDRTARMSFFGRHALTEAVGGLRHLFTSKPVPCLLAVPEPIGGTGPDLRAITTELATVAADVGKLQLSLRSPWIYPEGRAGVFRALETAASLLDEGHCDLAVVGGLDSLVAPEVLAPLIELELVRSDESRDGIIPGEGAAFVVLAHPRLVPAHRALATVRAIAVGTEPRPRFDSRPSQAEGLTRVFHHLRQQLGARVDQVFSAQTGQGFYGRQLAYAHLRNTTLMPEPMRIRELGPCLGDVGAAAGTIALVHAIVRMHPPTVLGRTPALRSALAYGMSDHGAVGGCVVAHTRA